MNDREKLIIEQLKRGDERAYQYIYEHHYALLCHVANNYLNDRFIAETIVGDTIFHMWEIRESMEIDISVRSYIMRAVRNRCINHLKAEQNRKEIPFSRLLPDEITENSLQAQSYPLGILLESELENEIRDAIGKLPVECRGVFMKSRFEEKSYDEIADELGISKNTVKYHIKNALTKLNEHLGKYLTMLFLLLIK